MPPAPPMFSTTICCPRLSLTRGAMSRAATSTGPPAVNGTTIVTGRVGHSCAVAAAVNVIMVASANAVAFAIVNVVPDCRRERMDEDAWMPASIGGGGSARLDRVRPFYQFAWDELGEIFRRAPFRRCDVEAQAFQALMHPGKVERIARRLGEAAHDRLGRPARQEECVPAVGVEAGEALLLRGREFRQDAAASWREQRNGFHRLAADERERGR